jgi:hypothetical protein
MRRTIQYFLLFEAATFVAASLVHAGFFIAGYEHWKARIAESVIAIVLFTSAAWIWVRPLSARTAGLAGQGFALFATLVGIFTIVVGVGPRTVPDVVYHAAIVAVLSWGLLVAKRA